MSVKSTERWIEWHKGGDVLVQSLAYKLVSLTSEQQLGVLESILNNKIPGVFSYILYEELWNENKDKVYNLLNQKTSICKWWKKSPKEIALEIFFKVFKFENYEEFLEKEDLNFQDICLIISNEFNLKHRNVIIKPLVLLYLENKKIIEFISNTPSFGINEKSVEILIKLSKEKNWMEIIDFFRWESVFPIIIKNHLNELMNLLKKDNGLDIIKKLWKNLCFDNILSDFLDEVLNLSKEKNWMKIIEVLWGRDDFIKVLSGENKMNEMNKMYNEVIKKQENISNIKICF